MCIKEVTNDKSKNKVIMDKINIDNNFYTFKDQPEFIANTINKYYVNIGQQMAEQIAEIQNKTADSIADSYTPPTLHPDSLFLSPVTEDEVNSTLNTLKTNSASGPDDISNFVLKNISKLVSKPLAHLCNLSFQNGTFPNKLKETVVIPVYKGGDKTLMSNYRPISLTNGLAKTFEKLIKKRLVLFLETKNLLSQNQFGFRQARSTQDALFELTKYLYEGLDNNKKCVAVFLDLAKAFDSVSHVILLKKLQAIGVRGQALSWFKTYLLDRQQITKIAGVESQPMKINYGVPQGTVLGPILYLIYANDLCAMKINGKIISFADDTAVLFQDETWSGALEKAETELNRIKYWLDNNLLSLNIEKTKFLNFSVSALSRPQNAVIRLHSYCHNTKECDCPNIAMASHIKYLGLVIDDRLTWQENSIQLTKRIRKLIHKFVVLRNVMDTESLKRVYYALVESLLSYGIIAWGGTNFSHIEPIYKVQKLILRISYFKPARFPSEVLFKEIEVLSLRQLYVERVLNYFYNHPQLKHSIDHSYQTRNCNVNVKTPKMNKTFGQKHAVYLSCKLFNKLPNDIKTEKIKLN